MSMKRNHPRLAALAAAVALLSLPAMSQVAAQRAADATPAVPPPAPNGPTIKISQGQVQGVVADGVVVYKGLPFAAPPVGDLRWRNPQPALKWPGVRPANAFSSTCAQAEDCLYLNIYEPAEAKSGDKLPVMVWIHGGAFVFGSGAGYDGTHFAQQGVIVVTVNYRLGRAGWFAHPALTAESRRGPLGNYGLMDQIAALEWVKDNIKAFGGDKRNVTIFGESAGAISINYLMLARQARGLFSKALAESGFGRIEAKPIGAVEQSNAAWAEKAGVHGSDAAAAKALRALSWSELMAANPPIGADNQILPMNDGKVITETVAVGFAKNHEARVPYLLGGNSDEASLTRRGLNASERLAAIQSHRSELLSAYDPDNSGDADRIMARLITDRTISEPDRDLARLHTQHGSPTFVYHFSYTPSSQRATLFGLPHGGELPYVFNTPRGSGFDEEGKAVSLAANQYWAQFAKSGDPDSAGGVKWPKFDLHDESLLEFPASGVAVVQTHFHKTRLDWVEASLADANAPK
jgi:para-nitrobenzyl esterase